MLINLGCTLILVKNPARGSKNGLSKLSEIQVLEIRNRFKEGDSYNEIIKDFPVERSTLCAIKLRNTWKHI